MNYYSLLQCNSFCPIDEINAKIQSDRNICVQNWICNRLQEGIKTTLSIAVDTHMSQLDKTQKDIQIVMGSGFVQNVIVL